jgi:hypothetical protein
MSNNIPAPKEIEAIISLLASSFWKAYNSEDSYLLLPFLLPLAFWGSLWIYYRCILHQDYSRWYKVHTLHHMVAIVIGCLSLHLGDNAVFHERIGILWSMPYFIVDILDSIYNGHWAYIFHGGICLGLGLCNYHVPLLMQLRMNSKAVFIESSSILLYQVKQNRKPWLFGLFALNYTLCRIVWIPIMGKELLESGLDWYHPIIIALASFYALQVHWWIKILKILKDGSPDGPSSSNKKTKDTETDGGTDTKKEK